MIQFFDEFDLKRIKHYVAKLSREYEIDLRFVMDQVNNSYIIVSVNKYRQNFSRFGTFSIENYEILDILSKQMGMPNIRFPYCTIFALKSDTFFDDYLKIIQFCRDMECLKNAFMEFKEDIPQIIDHEVFKSIIDLYSKYCSKEYFEYNADFRKALFSLINRAKKMSLDGWWSKYFYSAIYNHRRSKLYNLFNLVFNKNRNNVSINHLSDISTSIHEIMISESRYKIFRKRLAKEYPHVAYHAEKKRINQKHKLKKRRPWLVEQAMEDMYSIRYCCAFEKDIMKLLLRIDYGCTNTSCSQLDANDVFSFNLSNIEWENWLSLTKANAIKFQIDTNYLFQIPNANCIPIITYNKDFFMVNKILQRLCLEASILHYPKGGYEC